ncbi:MAG: hypothetical protein AAF489_06315 [Bacteroidota bacterium]
MSKKIKLDNRETLKNYFKNGTRPSEENFGSLIDSMINKADDGISKNLDDGLILAPEGENSNRTLSFFDKIGAEHPNWSMELIQGEGAGLGIVQPSGVEDEPSQTRMFFNKNGKVGVHTNEPQTDFEVDGVFGAKSKVGTYKLGTIPADGKWHAILEKLDGVNGFEVVAQVSKNKAGKHALLHATALSTFGQFKNRIRRTQAWYDWFWWNRLAIRWKGSQNDFRLELKTRSHYGDNIEIKYHITQLWGNDVKALFEPQETNQ